MRDEQKIGAGRRLLKAFQQRIRRARIQGLGRVDHNDLGAAAMARQVHELRERPHLVHADLNACLFLLGPLLFSRFSQAFRLHQPHIRMAPLLDPVTGGALAARCPLGTRLLTHQRFGERLGECQLPDARRAAHQQRVRQRRAFFQDAAELRPVPGQTHT